MEKKRFNKIKKLEKFYEAMKKEQQDVVYVASERLTAYSIGVKYDGDTELLAYTPLKTWDGVVDFCRKHSNGSDYIQGIGVTEPELVEATENFIHSQGKKTMYE